MMIKNIPNAINTIQWARELTSTAPEFEVKVWREGELVYHNKAYAGVINLVQNEIAIDFKDIDDPIMEGDSQVFGFGMPIEQLFAWDQMRKKLRPVLEMAQDQMLKIINNLNNEKNKSK